MRTNFTHNRSYKLTLKYKFVTQDFKKGHEIPKKKKEFCLTINFHEWTNFIFESFHFVKIEMKIYSSFLQTFKTISCTK